MPISKHKRRKSKSNKSPRQQFPYPIQPPLPSPPRFNILQALVNHPFALLIGLIASIFALGSAAYDAVRSADIDIDSSDRYDALAFPFTVTNKSTMFPMQKTSLVCDIDNFEWRGSRGPGRLQSVGSFNGGYVTTSPGATGLFMCQTAEINGRRDPMFVIASGHLLISVEYYTLWVFKRQSSPTEFSWFARGENPHWVKGIPERYRQSPP
jgi:hypothetical protein